MNNSNPYDTKTNKVLIITGPAGAGKSTVARRVSETLGWQYVSEDEYWVKNGWAHGTRAEGQEEIIQDQVLGDLMTLQRLGKSAVLEFILYKTPPNPLTNYERMLRERSIPVGVIALRPAIEEIMKRLVERGRPNDLVNPEIKRANGENQLRCLQPDYFNPDLVFDADRDIDEIVSDALMIAKQVGE